MSLAVQQGIFTIVALGIVIYILKAPMGEAQERFWGVLKVGYGLLWVGIVYIVFASLVNLFI